MAKLIYLMIMITSLLRVTRASGASAFVKGFPTAYGYGIGRQIMDNILFGFIPLFLKTSSDLPDLDIQDAARSLLEKTDNITTKLDMLSNLVRLSTDRIVDDLKDTVLQEHLDGYRKDIYVPIMKIRKMFNEAYGDYFDSDKTYDNKTILEFAEAMYNPADSPLVAEMDALDNNFDSFLRKSIKRFMLFPKTICKDGDSPQRIIYNDIVQIFFSYIKGASVMADALFYLKKINYLKNNTMESEKNIKNLEVRFKNIRDLSKLYVPLLSSEIWKCDAKELINGKSYLEFQRHANRYLLFDSPCENELVTCDKIGSVYEYCSQKEENSTTSFQYVSYMPVTGYSNYGYKEHCKSSLVETGKYFEMFLTGKKQSIMNSKVLNQLDPNFVEKRAFEEYMCTCNTPDTYQNICMEPVIANKSYVITGGQIVIENGVIMFQIQQGHLRKGVIDPGTIHWKPVNSCPSNQTIRLNINSTFYLDDLNEFSEILIGLRFKQFEKNTFGLAIATRKFEIEVNKLNGIIKLVKIPELTQTYSWHFNNNSTEKRMKIEPRIHLPTSIKDMKTSILSDPNSYFQLTRSDLNSDLAQRLLPFIDIQKVHPVSVFTFSGAGLLLKGKPNYSEFLSLKLIGTNYVTAIDKLIPEKVVLKSAYY